MKYILLIIMIFLTGCQPLSLSIDSCKKDGWNGIILKKSHNRTYVRCSNGHKSPNGQSYISHNGLYDIEDYEYFAFQK